jgi:hypothetical protein
MLCTVKCHVEQEEEKQKIGHVMGNGILSKIIREFTLIFNL